MAGHKTRLNQSIQRKLSVSLALAIVLVALVAGLFSFATAFDEAHELQDDTLRQVAALFDAQHRPRASPGNNGQANVGDEESRVIIQYLGAGAAASAADAPLALPGTLADGLQTVTIGNAAWRVLVKSSATSERIAVAQDSAVRDEVARNSALRTLLPLLMLVPILVLIVADRVRKMFRPVAALATEIDRRAEHEFHPVAEAEVPVEVRPFIVAINRLLTRVAQSMAAQRRFVADAAHELRSPMTAISLQAERLAAAEMSAAAHERLATLQRGIERSRALLDQLLSLAKVEATPVLPGAPVSVQAVYRRLLEDLMPLAYARQIDIGVVGEQDAYVAASAPDLLALLRNLVDNAIRYTQVGGRVDLSVATEPGYAVLGIFDNGPGIAAAERERVFDPFYRVLGGDQVGSGLGLSIVKAIAARLGATVMLGFSDTAKNSGLAVYIRMPLAG